VTCAGGNETADQERAAPVWHRDTCTWPVWRHTGHVTSRMPPRQRLIAAVVSRNYVSQSYPDNTTAPNDAAVLQKSTRTSVWWMLQCSADWRPERYTCTSRLSRFHTSQFSSTNIAVRRFSCCATTAWNNLPSFVCTADSFTSFKSQLKTYYVRTTVAYSCPRLWCPYQVVCAL